MHKSLISRASGFVTILGCLAVIVAHVVGILVVEQHNPVSETISKLAIGKYAWIQDIGLDLFAIGILAMAAGLYSLKVKGSSWKLGVGSLLLLAADIFLISEHNQYAGRDHVGISIHIECVYALAALFSLATLAIGLGLQKVARDWANFSLATCLVWTVSAPFFFFISTSWDGLYERLLAIIMIGWLLGMSWLLIRAKG